MRKGKEVTIMSKLKLPKIKLPRLLKMDKQELKWWIEDHRSKFIGLCILGVTILLALIFALYLLFKPTQIAKAPVENRYEEVDVDKFSVEEHLKKEDASEETIQTSQFGVLCSIVPYSISYPASYIEKYDYGYCSVLLSGETKPVRIMVNPDTFGGVFLNNDAFYELEKNKSILNVRGKIKALTEKQKKEWLARDYKSVLDLFTNPNTNSVTATQWNTLLSASKVSKGYAATEVQANIKARDWKLILEETYTQFQTYLDTLPVNPAKDYITKHPLPTYEDVCTLDGKLYLCDSQNRSWNILSNEKIKEYVGFYWNAYFSKAEEIFVNENEILEYKKLTAGTYYKLQKQVPFILDYASPEKDIVIWYRTYDGKEEKLYYSNGNQIWMDSDAYQDTSGNTNETNLPGYLLMGNNIQYFTYYVVGENYKSSIQTTLPFETIEKDGKVSITNKDLEFNQNQKFTREMLLGTNYTVNVSTFLTKDGTYVMKSGECYVKNDTKNTVRLLTTDEEKTIQIEPNGEIFIDKSILEFKWKVER